MKLIKCDSSKNEVVKHNDLMKAVGELSMPAQKMLASLISMIRSDDSEFQEHALHIESFAKATNVKSKNINFYKDRALELMKNPFELKKGIYFNWCNKVDITTHNGYIVFKVDNELKPYLLQIQNNFTKYRLINIMKLKGSYSPVFYEYLIMRYNTYKNEYFKQNKKHPKSYTFELNIDFLRENFKVPKSYRYNDIKRQIIDKAQKDFKEYTDIQFDYKEKKIGRKVDKLTIMVKDNNKGSNDFLADLQSFIAHMRKNYINQNILTAKDKDTQEVYTLSVSEKGILYSKNGKNFDAKRAKEMWQKLYELAKENKLECFDIM